MMSRLVVPPLAPGALSPTDPPCQGHKPLPLFDANQVTRDHADRGLGFS